MTLGISEADASPAPASEGPALRRVLGADLLARLLGISAWMAAGGSGGTAGAQPGETH